MGEAYKKAQAESRKGFQAELNKVDAQIAEAVSKGQPIETLREERGRLAKLASHP